MIRLPNLRGSVLAICTFPHVNLVVAPVQASKRRHGHDSSLGHNAKADSENGEGSGHQQNGAAAAGRHGGRSKARDDGVRGHGCNANRSMCISLFNRPLIGKVAVCNSTAWTVALRRTAIVSSSLARFCFGPHHVERHRTDGPAVVPVPSCQLARAAAAAAPGSPIYVLAPPAERQLEL